MTDVIKKWIFDATIAQKPLSPYDFNLNHQSSLLSQYAFINYKSYNSIPFIILSKNSKNPEAIISVSSNSGS